MQQLGAFIRAILVSFLFVLYFSAVYRLIIILPYKFPLVEIELRISGVESNSDANCTTTSALKQIHKPTSVFVVQRF